MVSYSYHEVISLSGQQGPCEATSRPGPCRAKPAREAEGGAEAEQ